MDSKEESAQQAEGLCEQVVDLYTRGHYTEAMPLARQALSLYEEIHDPYHPDTSTALINLGKLYQAVGSYIEAEPLLERALKIRETVFGPCDPVTAQSLEKLAGLYYDAGKFAKAEPLFQRALAVYEQTPGPISSPTACVLNDLAELYRDTGDYEKAIPLCKRALDIRETVLGPNDPDTAQSLQNLAGFYRDTGAYEKAESLYQRALEIRVAHGRHLDVATTLNNLALLYQKTGAYAKSEPLLQQALAIREKFLGPSHPRIATVLNNLALLYEQTGAYAKAEQIYQRALAIRKIVPGPDHPIFGVTLGNLARLYRHTGAYEKAGPLYQRALEIFEDKLSSNHPDVAWALTNLAVHCQFLGDYAEAERLLERALAIREKVLGPKHPDTASALTHLAEIYLGTGAYTKAEPLLKRALAIQETVLGSNHPAVATTLNDVAGLYVETGFYAKAQQLLQRVFEIRENTLGPEHPDTATTLRNSAWVYASTGEFARGELLLERAQKVYEANTRRFLLSGSEARKQAYLLGRKWSVHANVSFSLSHQVTRSTALGLTSVLQYKGRVLDAMSDSGARLRRSVAPEDRALFDQLSAVAQEYSTLTFRGPEKLSTEAYRERMDALAQEQEQLQTELSSRSAALREAVAPITLDGVRQALPADVVLVEWFRYEPFDPKAIPSARWGAPRYVAYLLKHTGEPVVIDLGIAQTIEDHIPAFRTALSDPASDYFKEAAGILFEKLIKPLRPHLAQSERLLLSPDGALNLVPFAALMDENGEYLLKHFELTYLTSGRDLLRITTESSPRESAVVVANPDYGERPSGGLPVEAGLEPTRSADLDRSGQIFPQLQGSADEAAALQSLLNLDAQHVLTGDQATEARLRELHGPHILHLATHGFFLNDLQIRASLKRVGFSDEIAPLFLSENPLLRSGLALAGANARRSGEKDDGILTAAEAAQLDLLGTQLVVLSACETGLGTVQTGEGVYGLRRALVLAGAQTQVVSLWKVRDTAARELMVDYYQCLLKGEGRSGALRAAQRAMIANPARQHPCYWAAFITIGNWMPLPGW